MPFEGNQSKRQSGMEGLPRAAQARDLPKGKVLKYLREGKPVELSEEQINLLNAADQGVMQPSIVTGGDKVKQRMNQTFRRQQVSAEMDSSSPYQYEVITGYERPGILRAFVRLVTLGKKDLSPIQTGKSIRKA